MSTVAAARAAGTVPAKVLALAAAFTLGTGAAAFALRSRRSPVAMSGGTAVAFGTAMAAIAVRTRRAAFALRRAAFAVTAIGATIALRGGAPIILAVRTAIALRRGTMLPVRTRRPLAAMLTRFALFRRKRVEHGTALVLRTAAPVVRCSPSCLSETSRLDPPSG